ncbi:MAG: hypothetical protein ACREMW_01490, partial [Gemmatimonadales bacterium]
MAAFFGKLQEAKPQELAAELRAALSQVKQEGAAFEKLIARGQESAERLNQLSQPVSEAQRTLGELQTRMEGLQRMVPLMESLDAQTQTFTGVQRRVEAQVAHAADDAKRLRAEVDEVQHGLEMALALKNDLAGFLELGGGFKALRIDADNLAAQFRDFAQGFDRVRDRQEEIRQASQIAVSHLNAFAERQQQMQGTVATTESRVTTLERTLENLSQASAQVAETKRQLGTVKALGDSVSQRMAALEQQRESVDRALNQAAQLNQVMQEISRRGQEQEANARDLAELEAKVKELKALHGDVLERSNQIAARQEEVERVDQELRGRLATARDEVQRTVERFHADNEGLETVGQRIADLRGVLTDAEGRVRALDESRRTVEDLRARTDGLTSQLSTIADDVAQLQTQAERVRAVQENADRLAEAVEGMTQRAARLEATQPTVEAVLRDFASLKGTHEALRDALEHVRTAASETARVRQEQAETKSWLAGVVESVDALRGKLAEVDGMTPAVEQVRGEAERVVQATSQIESRGQLVDELSARLSELTSLGSRLEERTQGLLARMDTADDRFKVVALHAEEAERIEKLMPTIVGAVERAERRIAEVDAGVASLESRRVDLEGLSERARKLGQELELRQAALDRASEHLQRASKLREEAATAAQELEERTRELGGGLATATGRLGEFSERLEELEGRSQNLRFMQKRMAQFEERLAKWEAAELELARALEQVAHRQATIDTLQAGIQRVFETAERTVEDVRSIAAAKQEVTGTRGLLENVLSLMEHAHDVANTLEHRKRQIEQAEERLGRAEALLIDIQSSLETLQGQKTLLDQVLEQAGALQFQAKQAEALIDTLRKERDLTDRVRAAVAELRQAGA